MANFLADAWPFAAAILVILGIAALAIIVVILLRVNKTLKSVQVMAEEAEKEITPVMKRVDPLMEKAELTVDTINLEMLRVDGILEDVSQISNVAGKTASTVDTVTSAPADAVTSIVDHLRGALGSKRKEQIKQGRVVYPIAAGKQDSESDAKSDVDSEAADLAVKVAATRAEVAAETASEAEAPTADAAKDTAAQEDAASDKAAV